MASLLLGLALLFNACTSEKKTASALGKVLPPLPELAPAYQAFTINTEEETVLTLPSGTTITVPANALVDEQGGLVKGEATILYREYHDAASVVLSGIPMDYNSDGRKRHFQTAGMFDIAGQQNGNPLKVQQKKSIQVDLASYEEGTDYNLFALDQEKGWEFVDYVVPAANPKRVVIEQEIQTLRKKMGSSTSPYFVFTYDGVLDVKFDTNPLSAKNRANSKVRRQFKAYQIETLSSSVYEFVKYETTAYPADMLIWQNLGRRFPSWLRNKRCGVELERLKGNTYTLSAQYANETYKGKIRVVIPLKYLFDYTPERWRNNLATVLKDVAGKEEQYRQELEALRLRKEQQAAVLRSFSVAGFGIYNYDRLLKEEEKIEILADFQLEEAQELDWVLCLPEDGKTIIKYPKSDWNAVVLLPNNKARFISILPDKRVAVYSAEAYQQLDFKKLAQSGERPQIDFKLELVMDELDSEAALRALLEET